MKTVTFDGGFTFDDPNLRWGDPAYQLEPGDPGYVPALLPNLEPQTKNKRMKRNSYFPTRQADQLVWIGNFNNKLPGYAAALGLTAGQVTAAGADCLWLVYVLQIWLPAARAWSLAATNAAAETQTGVGSVAQSLPVFTPPALPTGTVAVLPGALNRLFALVQQIKESGKCTDAIGKNLGIIGSEQSGPDLTVVQPVLGAAVLGNQVVVKWGWGGNGAYLESCEIQVDRGDGKGYGLLTVDTTPNYTDTQPFPATATRWSYRATYRAGDTRVGMWSQPVSVTVPA